MNNNDFAATFAMTGKGVFPRLGTLHGNDKSYAANAGDTGSWTEGPIPAPSKRDRELAALCERRGGENFLVTMALVARDQAQKEGRTLGAIEAQPQALYRPARAVRLKRDVAHLATMGRSPLVTKLMTEERLDYLTALDEAEAIIRSAGR